MNERDPMEIMFDADVEREFRWNKNFINRHSKEMGGRGRPRRFMRGNVQNFALAYFHGPAVDKTAHRTRSIRESETFLSVPSLELNSLAMIGGGKILGRGGKKRAAV